MSPASYQTAPPRIIAPTLLPVYTPSRKSGKSEYYPCFQKDANTFHRFTKSTHRGREGGREDQSRGSREKRGKGAKRPLRPPFAQKRLAERENASRITRWVLRVRLTSQFNQREGTGKEEVPAMAKTDPSNIANHAQADGPHGKKSPISESFGGLPCRFEAFRNALIRVTRSFSIRADTYRPTTFRDR